MAKKDGKDPKESPFTDLLDEPKTPETKEPEKKEPEKPSDGEIKKKKEESKPATPDLTEQYKKLEESGKKIERRAEASDFISSEQGEMFRQFSNEIKQAASDPRYFNIPIAQIPQMILKPSAYAKVLNDAREKADKEAASSTTGGTSASGRTEVPKELKDIDFSREKMKSEEFNEWKQRALRGEFKIKS